VLQKCILKNVCAFLLNKLIAQLQLHSSDAIFYSRHKKILVKNRKTATIEFQEKKYELTWEK
jgi:hypothetical protein